jgi:carboxyl-terminal processing protease
MFRSTKFWVVTITLTLLLMASFVGLRFTGDVIANDSEYEGLKVFTEVLSVVKRNYVEEVETKELIYSALRGMLKSLDPHSDFLPPDTYKEMKVETKGEFGGLGIQISIKDEVLTIISPIDDTPAWRIGLQAGDKIVKIEGESTKDMSLFDAVKLMRGKPGTKVTITIVREGLKEPKPYTITRAIIKVKSVKSKMLEDNIAYIKLRQFQSRSANDLAMEYQRLMKEGAKSLILDLRNNPGGLLNVAVDVSGIFLDHGTLVVYTKDRNGQKDEYRSRANMLSTSMPMVVMVNQGSASASEIVAGALKDWNRAVVLGTTTFGKGSVQSVIPLSDGSGVRLTTSKYYTPKGTSIQNTGITPDIEVVLKAKNGEKGHVVYRESDLKGRLDNEQVKADDDTTGNGKTDEDKERAVSLHSIDEADDVQLLRSIDLLKTWVIFKELPTLQ